MKSKALLTGAIIWGVIAIMIIAVFVLAVTGVIDIPFVSREGNTVIFASNTELVKEESFSASNLSSLEISTAYHDISISLTDGDTITVRQYDADSDNLFTATQSTGSLSIKIQPRTVVGIMSFNFSPRLEIELPESYASKVSLTTSSGSINYAQSETLKWADTSISTNSGTVRVNSGIVCGVLEVSTSSGSVSFGDIEAKSIDVNTTSGTIRLKELTSGGGITLKSSSGSINSTDISAGTLSVNTNSGTIRLESISSSGEASMESGSGSINFGGLNASSISVKTNSGTLHGGDVGVKDKAYFSSGSGSHNIGALSCASYEISSNSGTLRYEGVSGRGSTKSSSGSINIDVLDVKGDCTINTTSGTVRIGLADNQSFELNITTTSGSIRAGDIDLLYTDQRGNKAFGKVGSGTGGSLDIKSSSGSININ